MTVTYKKILQAMLPLSYISGIRLKSNLSARKIYSLKKLIDSEFDFYRIEEDKQIKAFHGMIKENGNIEFPSSEDRACFEKEIENLQEMTIDLDFEKVDLSKEDFSISAKDIADLEDFINFGG